MATVVADFLFIISKNLGLEVRLKLPRTALEA
jgi:hypothetical protein